MPDLLNILQKTPVWLQGFWLVWIVGLCILVAATARFIRDPTIETMDTRLSSLGRDVQQHASKLDEQSQKLDDVLVAVRRFRPIQIGKLALPYPSPPDKVGGPTGLLDATGQSDLTRVDSRATDELFATIEDRDALVNLVLNDKATIENLTLSNPHNVPPKDEATTNLRYAVELSVRNTTQETLHVTIPRGQVFENQKPQSGFQNLVAIESVPFELKPSATATISVPGFCFNRNKKAPIGQPGYISPLRVRFDFATQQSLWEKTEKAVRPRKD